MTWVFDVVVRLVDLLRAHERVLAAAIGRAEAARVHVPDVERGCPLDDPLGHELSHSARAREPVRPEAGCHPEASDVRGAEDELAVGRKSFGAIDEADHLQLLEARDAHDRVLHQLLEARPILLEKSRVEVGGNAVETPWCAVTFVAAHDEPT